jgi:hypothetical protein
MEYPTSVLEIAERQAARFPADIDSAVNEAEKAIRRLPEFDSLVDLMVHNAVQELIYSFRHRDKVQMKNDMGQYGGPAKVTSGASAVANRAERSAYEFHMAGTMLGLILGKDLESIAQSEAAIAHGHDFNARLCRRLMSLVPDESRVQDAVSEKRLRRLIAEEMNRRRRRTATAAC